ncbi:TPA: glucosaminidase domain-containing protein [Bacillus cereus]|nr:glucosaminidase domain-containing protein [Bacillus cereus]
MEFGKLIEVCEMGVMPSKVMISLTVCMGLNFAATDFSIFSKGSTDKVAHAEISEKDLQNVMFIKTFNYESDSTLIGTNNISAETLDVFFAKTEGSALIGMGKAVYGAATQNGVEPGILAAKLYFESGKGLSDSIKERNNPYNNFCFNSSDECTSLNRSNKVLEFDTLEDGILYSAQKIATEWRANNVKTVKSLAGLDGVLGDGHLSAASLEEFYLYKLIDMLDIEKGVRAKTIQL